MVSTWYFLLGTLTENDMIFRKCAVGRRLFGDVSGRLMELLDGNILHKHLDLSQVTDH